MIRFKDDQKLPRHVRCADIPAATRPKGVSDKCCKGRRRKLVQLNNATMLGDLVAPPGNRLEALRGDLVGKHSIRINDQWRIVFRWSHDGPEEVEILDYH